jgi:SAM-dependent methyltransferase
MRQLQALRRFLKARFPILSRSARRIRQELKRRRMRAIFTRVYRQNKWGDRESRSGSGSNLRQTETLRRELPALLRQLGVRSMLDIPCGDFAWMREVDLTGVRYIGADIVRELVAANQARYGDARRSFHCLDITRDTLPQVDLVFCRDGLVHLPNKDILRALANIRKSGARYLATTVFTELEQNSDIYYVGEWRRLNFQLQPFNFPLPLHVLIENSPVRADKAMAVWRLSDLP